MNLHDVITINLNNANAAIVLEQGIADINLVANYTPTQASVQVFKHFCQAVLPSANSEHRAINLYGSYGSGKSHLAVVLAQLLRDGANTPEFNQLIQRLKQTGQNELANTMQHTFLSNQDTDARPYLLVSLYASGTTSLGDKLMEGLFDALQREAHLNLHDVLPSTEYEVCARRLEDMIAENPSFAYADISDWDLDQSDFLAIDDLLNALKSHQPSALKVFLEWHKAVCYGQAFDMSQAGGKSYIEAYREAGKNLAEKYHYGGIVVLWDEFGHALEDLIGNPHRNAGQEIIGLQQFVETVCHPDCGHTIFVGVTHVSFQEYGERTHASEVVRESLEKIAGRFYKAFKIELNAYEQDGYHLLGFQKTWTTSGKALLNNPQPAKDHLLQVCHRLPLFQPLFEHLEQIFVDVYPLHPLMALGLFNLSKHAQANRTALTFFRNYAAEILNTELEDSMLWQKELIRLPKLVEYYEDSIKKSAGSEWRRYEQAKQQVTGNSNDEIRIRKDILSILILSQLLEGFKASDDFLACALFDAFANTAATELLTEHLAWLKSAGLIWKNQVTQFWTLAGEGGVDVDALIDKETASFEGQNYQYLLETHTDFKEDVLSILGVHDLDPSECGIIRSYSVELLTPPFDPYIFKKKTPLISAKVYLVLARDLSEVEMSKLRIQELPKSSSYFWIPEQGIESEIYQENDKSYHLHELFCRYLAIRFQLKKGASVITEDLQRQLEAKWEATRQAIKDLLQISFGRKGLEAAKCRIYQAGCYDYLTCHSWHGFKDFLAEAVNQGYPSEVPIRAMNMNTLRDEKYNGSLKVVKLVKRILEFAENPAYQTDLLGEAKETSELSSLTDGILGANQLFITRPEGLDIKKIDETEGNLKELLTLIHDTFLRKRENPYAVVELRNKLIAEPYGLPACALPMFTAIAIRHEVKRLRWGRNKKSDFAENLVEAFTDGNKLTIRLFEFSKKQFDLLFLLGQYFHLSKNPAISQEEYAGLCASQLREFVKNKPEAVRSSSKLDVKTQELVKFMSLPAKSDQDLAEFLIELLDVKNFLNNQSLTAVYQALQSLFSDFDKVENQNLHGVQQFWFTQFPVDAEKRSQMIRGLRQVNTRQANQLMGLLEKSGTPTDVSAKEIIHQILSKPFDACAESDLGRCIGMLETLFEQAKHVPEVSDNTNPDPLTNGGSHTLHLHKKKSAETKLACSPDDLEDQCKCLFNDSRLDNKQIVEVLEHLLEHFRM